MDEPHRDDETRTAAAALAGSTLSMAGRTREGAPRRPALSANSNRRPPYGLNPIRNASRHDPTPCGHARRQTGLAALDGLFVGRADAVQRLLHRRGSIRR